MRGGAIKDFGMKVGVIGFVAGVLLGIGGTKIFSEKREPGDDLKPVATPSSRVTISNPGKRSSIDVEDWRSLGDRELAERMSGAGISELQGVVEELVSQGDPFDGMAYADRKKVKKMLGQMAGVDLEGTVAWISGRFQAATRESLIVACLEQSIELDFEKSLVFTRESLDGRAKDDVVRKLLFRGVELGADEALAGLALMHDREVSGRSGSSVTFPDDFDFLKFGDGALELASGRSYKNSFSTFPSNFLEEWARRKPAEALEFYEKNSAELLERMLPFNEFDNLAEGYLGTVDPGEGAGWVEAVLESEETTSKERRDLLLSIQDLEEKRRPILEALIARRGDAAGKARVAGEFYDSLSRSAGGGVDEFRGEILRGFPDAESRMNHVIATAKANGRAVDRVSEELKALGHSEDEVARFREAAGK